MNNLIKYPSTIHLETSGIQKNDSEDVVPFFKLKGKYIVIEEKIDGGNAGISFDSDANLLLQSRGHYLTGHDLKHFDLFKTWAKSIENHLFDMLTDRYIMYGEWMYALHSIYYDNLDHYFYEFDIWDKVNKVFLSTERRHEMIKKLPINIESVKVLKSGYFNSLEEITSLVGISSFISENAYSDLVERMEKENYPQSDKDLLSKLNKDRLMEGLYLKWEEDGVTKGRYKFVRRDFTQTIIDGEAHWNTRNIISNKVVDLSELYT